MAVTALFSARNCFSFGSASKRLLEIIEAELKESRLFDDGVGFFKHLGSRGAYDGNTDFTDTGTKKLRGYAGHIHSHVYNRGILQTHEQGCKFLLKPKGVSTKPEHGYLFHVHSMLSADLSITE